ncbi:F-box and associated interaction domains-containing protein [Striga asiatica]|uniref:F-box and associated interaction domains-containing protein n=1 Tax=Striga asiatica TaxID=4170 RepID=A0A5A7NXH6_STRAF|nr:F-box and associated interaction domains-containing protein [Striga asiatica]
MATPAHRLIQDQNLNILYNGPTPGQKTDLPKADNKPKHLSGRKALNDISNARKPYSLKSVKRDNSTNVISIEKDPVDVRAKISKAAAKGKASSRKPLTDVTNSVKPPAAKQGLSTVRKSDVLSCVAEERFVHNHGECIKAQTNAVDMGYFLKSVGLSNDIPMKLSAKQALPLSLKKPERNNTEHSEIEMPFKDEEVLQCCSPVCRSPQSPKAPYMSWDDKECSEFMVIETPKLM